ncbi:hypothetical protein [Brevundimonas sp.]|uniref:hypothetical protein n=1 Tax=Brevundimonas sp. TaxID=1871086 RepID=UPI0025BFF83F|nr:hypothetical protein [Brevundimonas sp.]
MVVEDTRGVGNLSFDGALREVTYGLTVTERSGLRDGFGQLVGKDVVLFNAYSTDETVHLEMKDGRVAPIIITRYMAGKGLAEFKLAGAIVGPARPMR